MNPNKINEPAGPASSGLLDGLSFTSLLDNFNQTAVSRGCWSKVDQTPSVPSNSGICLKTASKGSKERHSLFIAT